MGVPASEVGYTSAGTDHEVFKGHVVALEGGGIPIVTPYKQARVRYVNKRAPRDPSGVTKWTIKRYQYLD
jgi:hypothetical protein